MTAPRGSPRGGLAEERGPLIRVELLPLLYDFEQPLEPGTADRAAAAARPPAEEHEGDPPLHRRDRHPRAALEPAVRRAVAVVPEDEDVARLHDLPGPLARRVPGAKSKVHF